jgi:pyrophosphatase PpaX
MPRNAVLLDLDGTLLDSGSLILSSFQHVRERFSLPMDDQDFRRTMGRPLREVFESVARTPAEAEAMVRAYREHNHARHDQEIRPFEGVPEALDALRAAGARLAVVTSKVRAMAERGLRVNGLAVEVVIGPDDVPRPKPAPDPVWLALERLGARPEEAVMVGDSPHDLEAGRAAGVAVAAVRWGMFSAEELAPFAPDWWLDHPRELPLLLR